MKIRLTKATLLSVLVTASALITPTANSASVKTNCVFVTGAAALVAGYTLVRNMREKRAIEAFEALVKQEMAKKRPRVYTDDPSYSKLYTGE